MVDVIHREFDLPPQLRNVQSVLWQMTKVAHGHHRPSLVLLQEVVNHLTEKANQKKPFTPHEKSFLKVLYECPWWGGREYGFNESKKYLNPDKKARKKMASGNPAVRNIADHVQVSLAKLAHHYVNGKGQCYPLNLLIYKNSVIVSDTIKALKNYIRELYAYNKPAVFVATDDKEFLSSLHAGKIEKKRRHSDVLGFIFNDGTLMLEQKDPRIRNIANRFKITAMTHLSGTVLTTRWRIEGVYHFEPFPGKQGTTGLPLTDTMVLGVPNSLSDYMASVELAAPFRYFTSWVDRY